MRIGYLGEGFYKDYSCFGFREGIVIRIWGGKIDCSLFFGGEELFMYC